VVEKGKHAAPGLPITRYRNVDKAVASNYFLHHSVDEYPKEKLYQTQVAKVLVYLLFVILNHSQPILIILNRHFVHRSVQQLSGGSATSSPSSSAQLRSSCCQVTSSMASRRKWGENLHGLMNIWKKIGDWKLRTSRVSLFQVWSLAESLGPTIVAAVVVETGLQVLSVGNGENNVCQMTASVNILTALRQQYRWKRQMWQDVARMVAMVAIFCSLQPPAVIGKTREKWPSETQKSDRCLNHPSPQGHETIMRGVGFD